MIEGLTHHTLPYPNGQNSTRLNTVDVWTSNTAVPVDQSGKQLWLIYIHGGAWRDPLIDSKSFLPAIEVLWKSLPGNQIAGFASINYRLSPYPNHPTHPSNLDNLARKAHHPDHLNDVANALASLETEYEIDGRYIVIGHSAGATLAFQLNQSLLPGKTLPSPVVVLGIAGIYSFYDFVENHKDIPVYEQFMMNAFPDRDSWNDASPYSTAESLGTLWAKSAVIVISRSKDDELVEAAQASLMLQRVRNARAANVHYLEVSGAHDEIWSSGTTLASLVEQTIQLSIEALKE